MPWNRNKQTYSQLHRLFPESVLYNSSDGINVQHSNSTNVLPTAADTAQRPLLTGLILSQLPCVNSHHLYWVLFPCKYMQPKRTLHSHISCKVVSSPSACCILPPHYGSVSNRPKKRTPIHTTLATKRERSSTQLLLSHHTLNSTFLQSNNMKQISRSHERQAAFFLQLYNFKLSIKQKPPPNGLSDDISCLSYRFMNTPFPRFYSFFFFFLSFLSSSQYHKWWVIRRFPCWSVSFVRGHIIW